MEAVRIKASQTQLSKLRCGHKVRISPAVEGEGIILYVHPERYSVIDRAFRQGKGKEIQLHPEEIQANKSDELKGQGIFGKKFDAKVQKVLGKKAAADVYKEADRLKKPIVAGIHKGADKAIDYVDGGSIFGKKFDRGVVGLVGKNAQRDIYKEADRLKKPIIAGIRKGEDKAINFIDPSLKGGAILGHLGGLISKHTGHHPALLSQPFSTNFQFQHTLPIAVQKYASGAGLFA